MVAKIAIFFRNKWSFKLQLEGGISAEMVGLVFCGDLGVSNGEKKQGRKWMPEIRKGRIEQF